MSDRSPKTIREFTQIKIDAKKLVQDRFRASEEFMRPYHARWRKTRNAYHGYVADKQRRRGRANFHFHKMFPQIELEAARFMVHYFARSPFIQVNPRGPTSTDAAHMHEMALQHFIELSPTFYLSKLRQAKYSLLYGSGFTMPTWKRETGKVLTKVPIVIAGEQIGQSEELVDELVYEGFDFKAFSPTDVYPYAYGSHILTLPWIIIMEFINVESLLAKAEEGIYDKSKVMTVPLNSYKQDEWELRRQYSDLGLSTPEMDEELICLLHMFSPDRFVTLANDEVIIRDRPNIFYHRRIPLTQGVKVLDPDSFWPIGTGHTILPNQRLRNLLGNASIDTVLKNLWPVWKYLPGQVNPNDLLSLPNHAIPVKHMNDVEIMKMPEMKQDILAIMALLEADLEGTTGYFGTQKGQSGQVQTATSDTIFQQEGNLRIKYDTMTYEKLTLNEEARLLSKTLQQFMPDEVAMKVLGAPTTEFQSVKRDDIQGEFQFSASGASEGMNKAIVQRQLIEFFLATQDSSQLIKLPGGQIVPMPLLHTYNAALEILQGFDHKGADRWLHRPEIFGMPVDNDTFEQFGLPRLEGFENIPAAPPGGGNGQGASPTGARAPGSRTVNPNRLLQNATKQPTVSVL